jgi:hypothetical protein
MGRDELERVRNWADDKLATGAEPPWAWYQYMKLRETLDAILGGMSAVTPLPANSPESGPRQDSGLRLVVCNSQPGSVRRHQSDEPVLLPM